MLSGLAPTTTISDMKLEVLSALQADVSSDALDFMAMDPPQISVESEADFELCRSVKERGKPTGVFDILEPSKLLKETGLSGWEAIFLQIRDPSTGKLIYMLFTLLRLCGYRVEVVGILRTSCTQLTGDFLPITYTLPSMYDEEAEQPQASHAEHSSAEMNKRKRLNSPSEN